MKETALTSVHISLGARMAEFAGFNMPISYSTISEEHKQVREGVGLFDVSHMGEFIVKGKEAEQLVQWVTSNDVTKLAINQAQYSCLPNAQGGIIDDLLVYRLTEDQCAAGEKAFMLVVNASNIQKDWGWIESQNTFDTRLINISDQTSLLALQGPKASALLQKLTEIDLSAIPFYHFRKGTVAGIPNVLVSATGYTGSGGFELYVENAQCSNLWNQLFEVGTEFGLLPIGLGARDTLRLEKGYCLYGNDITDDTSPLEAGLGWITKLKTDFVGKSIIEKIKKDGITRKLVGFLVDDRRVPRHSYTIYKGDRRIGEVTSGTLSPSLEKPIGMGYVDVDESKIGGTIEIEAGRKRLTAQIVKMPFVV